MSEAAGSDNRVTFEGPIGGEPSLASTVFDLKDVGYVQEEYFLAGSASSYLAAAALEPDGHWAAKKSDAASFKTRIVVYRPQDSANFSGVVAVEWLNVSAGFDMCPDWIYMHRELIRTGVAWIGVSAQRIGVEGGGHAAFGAPRYLKIADPDRYSSLDHPEDRFSFDIYTQACRLARKPELHGGVAPRTVIATGHSQSAAYLVTYINAVDPLEAAVDGFLIHGRPGVAAALEGANLLERISSRGAIHIREDVRVPVLTLQAETDVIGGLMSVGSRQPDSPRLRLWEVAGSAHGDNYVAAAGMVDSGLLSPQGLAELMAPTQTLLGLTLDGYANCAPQIHYVQQAAFASLVRWVEDGAAPPHAPLLEVESIDPPAFRLDPNGNALGGVRTPWVEAPTASYSGLPQNSSPLAALFGWTRPFTTDGLAALYPNGLEDYRELFQAALQEAVNAGHILSADAAENMALAEALYPR